MLTPILIALSLNFDTFSVAVVEGAQRSKTSFGNAIKVGIVFGLAHMFMVVFGVLVGLGFKKLISNTDHWVAFILLFVIGVKMIKESLQEKDYTSKLRHLDLRPLLFLAVATSIDALVVGITFVFLNDSILKYVAVIGLATFIISFTGYRCGKGLKRVCGNNVRVVGGLILIAIGVKTLLQHLYFGG